MKYHHSLLFVIALFIIPFCACKHTGTSESDHTTVDHTTFEKQIVLASCGQCQFGMGDSGCDLAIRIDGRNYFVDGTNIDDHGDAHAHDGFCEAIRQAEVTGTISNGRFIAEEFKLLN